MNIETLEALAVQIEKAAEIGKRIKKLKLIINGIEDDINNSATFSYEIRLPCRMSNQHGESGYDSLSIAAASVLNHVIQLLLAAEDELKNFTLNI